MVDNYLISNSDGYRACRTFKDAIFKTVFKDSKNIIKLYKELHPEDDESQEKDVQIVTLENYITHGPVNDLGFVINGRVLCLVEAQTKQMAGIILRSLIYLARTIERYILSEGKNIYTIKKGDVPLWEIYIIYSEKARLNGGSTIWRFNRIESDLMDLSNKTEIKLTAEGIVDEYQHICQTGDSIISVYGNEKDGLERFFAECNRHTGQLWKFVATRRVEIMGLYEDLWTVEGNQQMVVREAERRKSLWIAMNALNKGMSIRDVSEITGLSEEEIKDYSEEL